MNTQNLSTLKIHKLTQAQYNRELAAGNIDSTALYLTPDENPTIADISGLQTALNGKADASHTHGYLPLSGGTLTGSLTGGAFYATTLQLGSSSLNGGLELYHATPFIDFHFNRNTGDYTSRIVESASGTLKVNGMSVNATASHISSASAVVVENRINNSLHDGSLYISGAGNFGLFSRTKSKWMIYMDTSGRASVPGDLYVNNWLCVGGNAASGYVCSYQENAIDTAKKTFKIMTAENGNGVTVAGNFRPTVDIDMTCGTASYKWKQLYAGTTTIATSDRNEKKDFRTFDSNENYEKFFMDLKPFIFKFKDGESNRDHFGFVSQDIEESLYKYGFDDKSFAGFCKDVLMCETETEDGDIKEFPKLDENGNEQYIYGLRYSEFISLNTYMIQKTIKENQELKDKNEELETRLQAIENMLEKLNG